MEEKILDSILRKIQIGALAVTYPSGRSTTYGQGKPWAKIIIRRPSALRKLLRNPTMGFGEGYMNNDIEVTGDLMQIPRLVDVNRGAFASRRKMRPLTHLGMHTNRRRRQGQQIRHHYDIGNDFYRLWLDKSMTYSCAYFHSSDDTLEAAQQQKVDHVLRKLQLKEGMSLLDIGCGWGQLLIKAARDYGATGTGITLSQEQYDYCLSQAKKLGLEDKLTFELVNYQDLTKRKLTFDRIVSVGMFEHVGRGNHITYFRTVDKLLAPGGLTVLHSITTQPDGGNDPWIDRYIFPGGYLPTVAEVAAIWPKFDFRLMDYENLRVHYAMTLEGWSKRYESHKDQIINEYGERFYRMWRLYLAGSTAGFRWGSLGLSQFVFSKGPNNDLPLTREFLYSS